jgi:hypothetical protein
MRLTCGLWWRLYSGSNGVQVKLYSVRERLAFAAASAALRRSKSSRDKGDIREVQALEHCICLLIEAQQRPSLLAQHINQVIRQACEGAHYREPTPVQQGEHLTPILNHFDGWRAISMLLDDDSGPLLQMEDARCLRVAGGFVMGRV